MFELGVLSHILKRKIFCILGMVFLCLLKAKILWLYFVSFENRDVCILGVVAAAAAVPTGFTSSQVTSATRFCKNTCQLLLADRGDANLNEESDPPFFAL